MDFWLLSISSRNETFYPLPSNHYGPAQICTRDIIGANSCCYMQADQIYQGAWMQHVLLVMVLPPPCAKFAHLYPISSLSLPLICSGGLLCGLLSSLSASVLADCTAVKHFIYGSLHWWNFYSASISLRTELGLRTGIITQGNPTLEKVWLCLVLNLPECFFSSGGLKQIYLQFSFSHSSGATMEHLIIQLFGLITVLCP